MMSFSKAAQAKVNGMFTFFKHGHFTSADTETILNNASDIFKKCSAESLFCFFDDIKTMFGMIRAWVKRDYSEIPVRTIGMMVLTLIYIFAPVDAIPDYIPGVGLLDDAAMVRLCIAAVRGDIDRFRIWARSHL